MDLYRYISFEEFMSIVTLKRLHFVQPTQWPDTYEGCLYQMLENDENLEPLLSILYEASAFEEQRFIAKGMITDYYRILMVKHNWYGQCWTYKGDESDAFWRIYSYNNKAIRIRTSNLKVKKIFDSENYMVKMKKIRYDKNLSEDDLLKSQAWMLVKSDDTTESYFHKRKAFSHEREYRVLVSPKRNLKGNKDARSLFLHSANEFAQKRLDDYVQLYPLASKEDCVASCASIIRAQKFELKKAPPLYVPVDAASDFITEVLVTPLAADWYVELVEGICNQNNIPFAGKSHLYDAIP